MRNLGTIVFFDGVMQTVMLFSLYKFRVACKVLPGHKACQLSAENGCSGMERYLPKMESSNPHQVVSSGVLAQIVGNLIVCLS